MNKRHEDDARFSAYVLDELKNSERKEVEDILENSADAREYMREMQDVARMLNGMSTEDAPEFTESAHNAVKEKIAKAESRFNVIPFPRKKLATATAGIAGVAVAGFAFVFLGPSIAPLYTNGPSTAGQADIASAPPQPAGPIARLDKSVLSRPAAGGSNAPSLAKDNSVLNSPASGSPVSVVSQSGYRVPLVQSFQSRFTEPEYRDSNLQPTRKHLSPVIRHRQRFTVVAQQPVTGLLPSQQVGSYRRIRQNLSDSLMPNKNEIRIEEMINFFSFGNISQTEKPQIDVKTEVAAAPWQPRHQLVRITVNGSNSIQNVVHKPSNLVLLLNPGSFADNRDRAEILRDTLGLIASRMNQNDRIAIYTGAAAGESANALDSTSGENIPAIMQAIENWQPTPTALTVDDLQNAYQLAKQHFIEGGVNRVILATDSDLTAEVADRGALNAMIRKAATGGVELSIMGFQSKSLRTNELKEAASYGEGSFYEINEAIGSQKAVLEEIGSKPEKLANKIGMAIEFNPKEVFAYRLIGYETVEGDRAEDIDMKNKEFFSGSTYTAMYEIIPLRALDSDDMRLRYQRPTRLTKEATSGEILTVNLRYQDAYTKKYLQRSFPLKGNQQSWREATTEYKFASSVALFGMLLRDRLPRTKANYNLVLALAKDGQANDTRGFRKEFVQLVRKARDM